MRLYALLEGNAETELEDREITGITNDSRNVEEGYLFVCIKGEHFDGHTKAAEMLAKGAAAVVVERDLGLGKQQILVPNTYIFYGQLCAAWFGTSGTGNDLHRCYGYKRKDDHHKCD